MQDLSQNNTIPEKEDKKVLTIALAGHPNVGKSTIINRIIGKKISIVTHKVQTTRFIVKGVRNFDKTQLIFIDTPGLVESLAYSNINNFPSEGNNLDANNIIKINSNKKSNTKLENFITKNAIRGIKQADVVVFIFDISNLFDSQLNIDLRNELSTFNKDSLIEKMLRNSSKNYINQDNQENTDLFNNIEHIEPQIIQRYIAILNKVDLLKKSGDHHNSSISNEKLDFHSEKIHTDEAIKNVIQVIKDKYLFEKIFVVSGLQGDGIDDFMSYLISISHSGKWLFNNDIDTDINPQQLAQEITREKLYLNLHAELPYSIKVSTDLWEEQEDDSVMIHQSIYVLKQSQKGIVLGEGGSMIKKIGQNAREEIQSILNCRVHLYLHVKVKENWTDKLEEK